MYLGKANVYTTDLQQHCTFSSIIYHPPLVRAEQEHTLGTTCYRYFFLKKAGSEIFSDGDWDFLLDKYISWKTESTIDSLLNN